MIEVIFTKGIPGSGKSYWAKKFAEDNPSYIRINRDDLRNMRGKYWLPKQEGLITNFERSLIEQAIDSEYNVIIDAMHVHPRYTQNLIEFVKKLHSNIKITVKDFTDVPLEICLKRNLQRLNSIDERIVRRLYYDYILKCSEYKQPDPKKSTHAIICDLDGTLAKFRDSKNPYERDFINDEVNTPVLNILLESFKEIIFVSGRSDKFRNETEAWLQKHLVDDVDYKLYMRRHKDHRKDYLIKKEIFDTHIRDKYYINFVMDDRNQCVELWRSLGLMCFQVADGNF